MAVAVTITWARRLDETEMSSVDGGIVLVTRMDCEEVEETSSS